MKYTIEIEINKPIDEVVKLFNSEDNLFKWMEGLQSIEHLTGEPGTKGSTSKMIFKQGKKEMEMLETVISLNLPEEFIASYEARGVYNLAKTTFLPLGDHKTKYLTEQEFQLKGLMKAFGWIMPGAFKKQTEKYLQMFKEFAEEQ